MAPLLDMASVTQLPTLQVQLAAAGWWVKLLLNSKSSLLPYPLSDSPFPLGAVFSDGIYSSNFKPPILVDWLTGFFSFIACLRKPGDERRNGEVSMVVRLSRQQQWLRSQRWVVPSHPKTFHLVEILVRDDLCLYKYVYIYIYDYIYIYIYVSI